MEEKYVPEISPVCMEEGVRVHPFIHYNEDTVGFDIWVHFEADWSIGLFSITMDIEGDSGILTI